MSDRPIVNQAEQYMEHAMIRAHAVLPPFPALRAEWLRFWLQEYGSGDASPELHATVVALVQTGLDTHDGVPVRNNLPTLASFRSMQLNVLAGDFFSSRFYELLARIGDIETVRRLSAAICEINVAKIQFYEAVQKARLTVDEYMRYCMRIKLPLFEAFQPLIPKSFHGVWQAALHALTECELLVAELRNLTAPHRFFYWHIMEHGTSEEQKMLSSGQYDGKWLEALTLKYQPARLIYRLLEEQTGALERLLQDNGDERVRREWLLFSRPLHQLIAASHA